MNERLDELVQAWLDGELPAEELAELRASLGDRLFLAQAAALVREHQLVRAACRADATAGARRVAAVIEQRQRGRVGTGRLDAIRGRIRASRINRWSLAAAALVIGAILFLVVPQDVVRDDPRDATGPALGAVSAGANLTRDGQTIALVSGMELRPQDLLWVPAMPADGRVELSYLDRSHLQLLAGTQARVWEDEGAKRIRLAVGEIHCEVAHQESGKAMRLLTDHAEIEVVGTRFSVQTDLLRTHLMVSEGTVSFSRQDGNSELVQAGGSATAEAVAKSETSLYRYDFEDGAKIRDLDQGNLVPGPPRAGNRYCLAAMPTEGSGTIRYQVVFTWLAGLTYEPGSRLRFACWYDSKDTNGVTVAIWNNTQKCDMRLYLPQVASRQWTQLDVRLDDLRASGGAGCAPGDEIGNLNVWTHAAHEDPLFIDDLSITVPRK